MTSALLMTRGLFSSATTHYVGVTGNLLPCSNWIFDTRDTCFDGRYLWERCPFICQ